MSGVLNECDALLQAATVRIFNPKNAYIDLALAAPGFHVAAGGAVDIAVVTVTANLVGLDGDVAFSAQGATLSNATARTVDINYDGGTAIVTATVVANGETFERSCIIPVLRDGSSGGGAKVVTLAASAQVFKINKAGASDIASITLDATGQNTTGTPSFTIPAGTATLSAGANSSQKILNLSNMGTDSVTVRVTLDGQTDQITIIKVREGVDGIDAIAAVLSNESVTLTADAAGAVASVSGAVCTMSVYKGIADDSAAWSYAYAPPSATGGLAYSVDKNTITVTGFAAGVDVAFVDITASRTGYASITKRFSVSKSKAGAGGAGTVGERGAGQYYAIGSSWSDVVADMATPGSNIIGDQVTISDGTVTYTKRWDGDSWEVPGAYLAGDLFVESAIHGSKLKAGSIELYHPDGRPILTLGGLQPQFAAPGTKNSELPVGGNLISNSDFAAGTTWGWGIGYSDIPANLVEWGLDGAGTDWRANGTHNIYHHRTGDANGYGVCDITCLQNTPVIGGRRYEVGARLASHRTDSTVNVRWFKLVNGYETDCGSEQVVSPPFRSTGGPTLANWARAEGFVTAPADAQYARVAMRTYPTDAGQADSWCWGTQFFFAEAQAAQTQLSAYSRGAPADTRALGFTGDMNASYGAPSGSMVGGTEAGLLASRALAGQSAYNAQAGFNEALAAKLSAAGNQILKGPIALQDGGAIVIGTVNDGVIISATGIAVRRGGQTLMTLPISGSPTFAGELTAPSGTLNKLKVLDTLFGGDYDGWGWPAPGKNGFALGTSGLLLGNYFNGLYFEARRNGELFTPQIESTAAGLLIKGNTTINGALFINPNFGNRTASIDNAGGNVFYPYRTAQNSFCGSHTASISGAVNPTYSWSISSSAVQATFYLGSTTNAQTQVYVSAKGALAGDEVECILTCVISDGGVTTSASKNIIAQFQ